MQSLHTESPTPPTEIELTLDDVFHILKNKRRRNVLVYLKEISSHTELKTLTEQVAAWEYDTTVEQLESDQRKRVYIAL